MVVVNPDTRRLDLVTPHWLHAALKIEHRSLYRNHCSHRRRRPSPAIGPSALPNGSTVGLGVHLPTGGEAKPHRTMLAVFVRSISSPRCAHLGYISRRRKLCAKKEEGYAAFDVARSSW